MRKSLSFILFSLFISSFCLAQDSDSLLVLKEVNSAVRDMKKSPVDLDKALRKAVGHYDKSRDKIFLVKLLENYDAIFKENKQHYIVEMFFVLYQKDKKIFKELLDKSLSQKNKNEFMKRMNIVSREEQGGNG